MKILYLKTTDPSLKHINDFLHDNEKIGLRNRFGDSNFSIILELGICIKTKCEKKKSRAKKFFGVKDLLYTIYYVDTIK